MDPVIKNIKDYGSLDEIQQRKDEVLKELRQDSAQASTTKADYIASLVSNSIVAFDTFILIRKLMKSYHFLFGGSKKKKKKK